MSEWVRGSLGELASGVRGVSYTPSQLQGFMSPETVVLLRSNNIKDGQVNFDNVQLVPSHIVSNEQLAQHGDIAVCMSNGSRALVGKSGRIEGNEAPCTVGAFCSIFRPHAHADEKFVSYVFQSGAYRRHLDIILAGSAINNLRNSDVEQFSLEIPPRQEQRFIARILDTLDNQIQKTQALIAKLEKVKEGLLHDLLTRGIDESGRLRPSPVQAPELYKESPLGLIPREWEVEKTKQFSEIVTGSKDTQDKDENGVYPFFVRSQKVERINSFSYDCTGVLTAGDGVGTGKVFHYIEGRFDLHQRVYLIFNFSDHVEPRFFFEWFRLKFIDRVSAFSAKNTVDSVRMEMIADMPCPAPPLNEQKAIVNCLLSLQERIDREKEILIKARTQKSGLMDDLLTGRVRVTPLLDQAQATTPA